EGSHLFVRFEKRGLTSDAALRAIAAAMGVPMREVGIAGLKDKQAVTTQMLSLPIPPKDDGSFAARVHDLTLEGIRILDAKAHTNKLKTGHLRGNRFTIQVRQIPKSEVQKAADQLGHIGQEGLPNAFGPQRFGRMGDNPDRARAWLTGRTAPPRDP